jgi:hypothetical protein
MIIARTEIQKKWSEKKYTKEEIVSPQFKGKNVEDRGEVNLYFTSGTANMKKWEWIAGGEKVERHSKQTPQGETCRVEPYTTKGGLILTFIPNRLGPT